MDQLEKPSSPALSDALFSLFTTLHDDILSSAPSSEAEHNVLATSASVPTPVPSSSDVREAVPKQKDLGNRKRRQNDGDEERKSQTRFQEFNLPGYVCFSSTTGEAVKKPRRSAFTNERRAEVRELRKLGACLRCKLRKITCSGEDPCKACLSLAQARIGSRALMWMECIRPSFDTMTIFAQVSSGQLPSQLAHIRQDFLRQNDTPEVGPPFEMNLQSASEHLAQWLVNGTNHSDFSVAHFLRSRELGQMLERALGQETSHNLRLLVFLTNNVLGKVPAAAYRRYTSEELHEVGNYVGTTVLRSLDSRLKPAQLESSREKLANLQALFVAVLALSVTARSTFLTTVLGGDSVSEDTKRKTGAYIRLLNHYLVYLSKLTSLIEPSSEQSLATKCQFEWDREGSHTWRRSVADWANDESSDKDMPRLNAVARHDVLTGLFRESEPEDASACSTCDPSYLFPDQEFMPRHFFSPTPPAMFSMVSAGQLVASNVHIADPPPAPNGNLAPLPDLNFSALLDPITAGYDCSSLPDASANTMAHNDLYSSSRYDLDSTYWLPNDEPHDHTESPPSQPVYWTFFNQAEPFEIYDENTQRAFSNKPKIVKQQSEQPEVGPQDSPPKQSMLDGTSKQDCGPCTRGFGIMKHSTHHRLRRDPHTFND